MCTTEIFPFPNKLISTYSQTQKVITVYGVSIFSFCFLSNPRMSMCAHKHKCVYTLSYWLLVGIRNDIKVVTLIQLPSECLEIVHILHLVMST